ncbi:MAG: hypothetical protein A2283_02575 [Lentisphaerae bacterium RIFOXYA12_FULL_48_11]|nr:MAG: hypothetical protein A2283_02575 [Lentisphaerae bacterium RIFOXYA12_FULL_48_11]
MLYRLIFITGNLKGQKVTVDNKPMTIGRDPECEIRIIDSEAASKHAILEHNTLTGLHIKDMGSMNKMLVNNLEIKEAHLKHGDIVEIGRTRFLVQATVETDLTKNAPKRRRHISLTPLIIIIPLLVVIYGVVSFCQRIIIESSKVSHAHSTITAPPISNSMPVRLAVITSNINEKVTNTLATESLKPISDEIRQMREDLVGIKQSVRDLAVKPPAATTAPVVNLPPIASTNVKPAVQTNALVPIPHILTEDIKGLAPATKPFVPPVAQHKDPQIKISYLEQQKFKENEDFDEMRLITIGLNRQIEDKNMDNDLLRVEVSFFDQSADMTAIVPTRAVVPTKALKPLQWVQDTQSVVTAAYVVPKGSRKSSTQNTAVEQFYGYVIRVYYDNSLQDEDARPKNLLHFSAGPAKRPTSSGSPAATGKP